MSKMNINFIRLFDRKIGIPICYLLTKIKSIKRKRYPLGTIKNPKKIIIIKMWGIGTIIQCSPTFKAIRDKYPKAKITFLTMKNNEGVYDNSGLFDNIIYFPIDSLPQISIDGLKLIKKLRGERFDLLFDFEPIARFTAILSFFIKAKVAFGFDTKKQGREEIFDIKIAYEEKSHISKIMFKFAESIGIKDMPDIVKPTITGKDKQFIDYFIRQKKINNIITVNINTSKLALERRWPLENFVKVIGFLIKKGQYIILIGASSERSYSDKAIKELMRLNPKAKAHVYNLAGKISLKQLTYLFDKSKLFITNDSGPLHIALSTSCKTISFFGPETPDLYGPLKKKHKVFYTHEHCSPCMSIYDGKVVNCRYDVKCIKNISSDEVISYLKTII